jgi:hypothetical protein
MESDSETDKDTRMVTFAIWLRTYKKYQSIVALAKQGLAEDSHILIRSLLEAVIQLCFIARSEYPLARQMKRGKFVVPLPEPDSNSRAQFFIAHEYFEMLRAIRQLAASDHWRQTVKPEWITNLEDQKVRYGESLGAWGELIWETRSYSGFPNLRELCSKLGSDIYRYYDGYYKALSWRTHSVDSVWNLVSQEFERESSGDLLYRASIVPSVLLLTFDVLIVGVLEVNKLFSLDYAGVAQGLIIKRRTLEESFGVGAN